MIYDGDSIKIYCHIPFTHYFIGRVSLFHPAPVHTGEYSKLCLFTRPWSEEIKDWYWRAIL